MSMHNVQAAKAQLARLIARARAGEDVVITRRGEPVARLVAVEPKSLRQPGLLRGQIKIADDFDAPLCLWSSDFGR
jgi:prevent-host-death family protein